MSENESNKPGKSLGDTLFGLGAVVVGLVVVLVSRKLAVWDDFGPGPGMVPLFMAGIMMLFGIAVIIKGGRPRELPEKEGMLRLALYLALVLVCVALFARVGALASFGLFFIAELILVEKYPVLRSCVIVAVTLLAIHLVFSAGLQMRLPPFPWR